MAESWYFRNRDKTWGPFSTAEIHNLAAAGLLHPHDPLWPEDGDADAAVMAGIRIDFSSLQKMSVPAPDWLADVEEIAPGPKSIVPEKSAVPDWLADVGPLDDVEASPQRAAKHAEDLAAEFLLAEPGATPAEPPPVEIELAPEEPPPVEPEPPVALPVAKPVKSAGGPVPIAVPVKTTSNAPDPSAAQQAVLQLMGFDPKTGRILDAKRFRDWQKEQKEAKVHRPTKSVEEVFREARAAIEQWVDAPENRDAIVRGDWGMLSRDAVLQDCLNAYRSYGPEMMDRLWQHLKLVMENRQKFYLNYDKGG